MGNWKDHMKPAQRAWWTWYMRERVDLDIRRFRSDTSLWPSHWDKSKREPDTGRGWTR